MLLNGTSRRRAACPVSLAGTAICFLKPELLPGYPQLASSLLLPVTSFFKDVRSLIFFDWPQIHLVKQVVRMAESQPVAGHLMYANIFSRMCSRLDSDPF